TSSVANYQAALRSVTYFNSSDNPSTATRTISYQVDDGAGTNHASSIVTATVAFTLPNLVADTVTLGSTTVVAGSGTSVSYHLANLGAGAAGPSISRVYLSTDNVITTADTLLGSVNDGTLSSGTFLGNNVGGFTLSTPGSYWIGVIADATGLVAE